MTTATNRDEALAWLVGRLRWERLLLELHERTAAAIRHPDLRVESPAPARAA
jgi:hypothetical protein